MHATAECADSDNIYVCGFIVSLTDTVATGAQNAKDLQRSCARIGMGTLSVNPLAAGTAASFDTTGYIPEWP